MQELSRTNRFHIDPSSMAIPWIDSPFFESLLEASCLTPAEKEQVRFFAEEGYLLFDPELPPGLIDQAVADIVARFDAPESEEGRSNRIQDAWQFSTAVKQIAVHPNILQLLETIYLRKPIPFQTLNFKKGTEQKTHSDAIHFQSAPANFMCGVWVALEDVNERNGALHYYPKSHKMPLYDMLDLGLPAQKQFYGQYEEFVQSLFALGRFEKRQINIRKGQALLWAANLFHGGDPILDRDRTRLSQVTHYYFPGCIYYTPVRSELFQGRIYFRRAELMDIRTGEPIPHFYNGQPFELWQRIDSPPSLLQRIVGRLKRQFG